MQRLSSRSIASLFIISAAFVLSVPAVALHITGTITAGNLLTGGRTANNSLGCSAVASSTYYYATADVTVPVSGAWTYLDLSFIEGLPGAQDLWVTFYSGTFDAANPLGGGCIANYDDYGTVNLTAGVHYTLVISTVTPARTGAFELELTQTTATAGSVPSSPFLNPGRLNDNAALCSTTLTGSYPYVTSQFTPSVTGDYTYLDLGYAFETDLDMWIAIYDGVSFDPSNPAGNGCVANFDNIGAVHLIAGHTYTIVVTGKNAQNTGSFRYILYTDATPPVTAIPALSPRGLALLGLLVGFLGIWALRRRRFLPGNG